MKKTIILIGIIGLVFVCGLILFVNHAQALPHTEYDNNSMEWGNKFGRYVVSGQDFAQPYTMFGQVFRCRETVSVNNILMYYGSRAGTWTPGLHEMRFGIQEVNMTIGNSTEYWAGPTNNAFATAIPVGLSWNNFTLGEPVTLEANRYYWVGYHDFNGIFASTRYISGIRMLHPSYVIGVPPDGSYEEGNHIFYRFSTTTRYCYESGTPYLIWNKTTNVFIGQPYNTVTESSINNVNAVGFNFTCDETFVSDSFKVMLRRDGDTFPDGYLFYDINYSSNNTNVVSGILARNYEGTVYVAGQYQLAVFPSSKTFYDGIQYTVKLWSNATLGWATVDLGTTAPLNAMLATYQNESCCSMISTNNGTTWSCFNKFDPQFMFNKLDVVTPTISIVENLVDCSGTYEYTWNPLLNLFNMWLNYSRDPCPPCFPPGNVSFQIHNPNPANNTFVNGSYLNNNLSVRSGGENTAIDITYENFIDPPAVLPGTYSMTIIGSEPDNTPVVWNTSTTGVYLDVHDDTTGQLTPGNPYVGQCLFGGEYIILRSFVVFNTSSIPEGATINSGYLQLYVYDDVGVVDDFNVTIQQCRQPIPHYPTLVKGDYYNHGFTGDMGNKNTSGFVDDDMFLIELNASGVSDIFGGDWKLTDSVRWALVSARDYYAIPPVNDEFIIFYGYGVDTSKHPRLIINYTVPVSNWEHIVNLTYSWSPDGTVFTQYGTQYADENTTYSVLNPNMSGPNTQYWWRCVATNNSGVELGNNTYTFTTGNIEENGFSNISFLMDNPNPANGTCENYNLIQKNSLGLKTCINITNINFNTTPEDVSPDGTLIKYGDTASASSVKLGLNYNTVRTSATGTILSNTSYGNIGQLFLSSNYFIYRPMLFFDTSNIPNTAIIDTAKLTLYSYYDNSVLDFNIVVQNGQPDYPHNPVVDTDFNYLNYAGDGGIFNTVAFPAVKNPFDINLNASGLTWINKTGFTKLILRSNNDIDGVAPIGYEYSTIYLTNNINYFPFITVTYHMPPVNWSRVVNLTFYSNSTNGVDWVEYGKAYAVSNGSWCVLNPNMSNASTQYWWMVNASINGSQVDSQVFTFTTGNASLIVASTDHRILYLGIGGTLGGILTMVCIPYIFVRRRNDRRQEEYE